MYLLFHFKYKECTLILSYKKQTLCVFTCRECPRRFTLDCEYFGESLSVDLSLKKVLSATASFGNVALSKVNCLCNLFDVYIIVLLLFFFRSIFSRIFSYFHRFRVIMIGAAISSLKTNRPYINRESKNRERKHSVYTYNLST